MKNLLIGAFCVGLVQMTSAAIPEHYQDLKFTPSAWMAPDAQSDRQLLANGIPLYLIPDHSLPVVRLHVLFRGPGYTGDSNHLAARELLRSMLVQGGTQALSGAALADSLEFSASNISIAVNGATTSLDLECLSKDFPAMLELLKQSALHPGFDPQVLELRRRQMLEAWQHRWDRPANISPTFYKRVMYGNDPSLWSANPQEIKKVTQEDLKKEWQGLFDARKMLIGVSGDVDPKQIKTSLEKWTANWPMGQGWKDTVTMTVPRVHPGLYLIDRETSQSQIHISAPFVKRPNDDYYPAALAAYILAGGGFGSRLVDKIRTDEGLAYHVGASVGNAYFMTPTVDIAMQTKTPSTARALEITWQELDRFLKDGPDSTELVQAQNALIQSLPSNFDSPEATIDALLTNELYGRSLDYYRHFNQDIAKVTRQQVRDAARKYFEPKNLSITIVGPKTSIFAEDKHQFLKQFKLIPWTLDSLDMRH